MVIDDPWKKLAAAIIGQARVDIRARCWSRNKYIKHSYQRNKEDAIRFLNSKWFEELCYGLNYNPDWVRRKIYEKRKK